MRPDIVSTFVSVDIETTGLNPEKCDTIEVGAVIDDWLFPMEIQPNFHCYIKKGMYKGEPYALSMHAEIFRRIAREELPYTYLYPGEFSKIFGTWLEINGAYVVDPDNPNRQPRGVVAGKNFASFDDRFLRRFPRYDQFVKFHHRVLDPCCMLWQPAEDTKLPDSLTCKKRTHQHGEVAHTALEDAKDVVKMIQTHVGRVVPPSTFQTISEFRRLCNKCT